MEFKFTAPIEKVGSGIFGLFARINTFINLYFRATSPRLRAGVNVPLMLCTHLMARILEEREEREEEDPTRKIRYRSVAFW